MDVVTLTECIDERLPQTQCGQCGYAGCRPYAEAIARQEADINRCPPGGQATIDTLAALLDRAARALDSACGTEQPRRVAAIVEADCIGCTRCIQACPVDAIVGAAKLMHTVLSAECTGCELCLPVCPTDCIAMPLATVVPGSGPAEWSRDRALHARERYRARRQRLTRRREEQDDRRRQSRGAASEDPRKALIAAALARTRAKRAARGTTDDRQP